jgi:hypothetical protein
MTQEINLFESRLRPRHELATGHNLGIAAALLLVVMTAFAVYAHQGAERKSSEFAALQAQVRTEQDRVTALTRQLAERRVSPALLAELSRTGAMLATRKEVMDVLDSGRLGSSTGFSGVMFGFARQAQSDLWLTGFSVAAGGAEIEIRGRLLDPAKLPGYVQRLSGEPVFHGRRFATLEMRGVEPEAPKPEQGGVEKVVGPGVPPPAPVALPRFVEFALRSENAAGAVAPGTAGVKP